MCGHSDFGKAVRDVNFLPEGDFLGVFQSTSDIAPVAPSPRDYIGQQDENDQAGPSNTSRYLVVVDSTPIDSGQSHSNQGTRSGLHGCQLAGRGGAYLEGRVLQSLWSPSEARSSINLLEVRAIVLALQELVPLRKTVNVLVYTDNTT